MASYNTIKDHFRETRLFISRAVIALTLTIVLMLVLLARLVYLQILEHNTYKVLSDKNRIHIRPVPPTRGQFHFNAYDEAAPVRQLPAVKAWR